MTDGFAHKDVEPGTHAGKTNVWLTPRYILDAVGPFELDPCGAPEWPTATRHIYPPDDGLLAPWEGFVWMNPPYGDYTAAWMKRLADHNHGIALVFARTETQWFIDAASKASLILFLSPRVAFVPSGRVDCPPQLPGIDWGPPQPPPEGGSAGCGSCLIGFGDLAWSRLMKCKLGGTLMEVV